MLREKRIVPLEELLRPGGPQTIRGRAVRARCRNEAASSAGKPALQRPAGDNPLSSPRRQPETPARESV